MSSTWTRLNCSRKSCGFALGIQKLTALLRVLLVVFKISGYSLNQTRLPDGNDKRSLLRAIERSRSVLPLRSVLRVIRLVAVAISQLEPGTDSVHSMTGRPVHDLSPQQLTAAEVECDP